MGILRSPRGLTLLELLLVLAILAGLAGVLVPLVSSTIVSSQRRGTEAQLLRLRDIIMGTPELPGYWSDVRQLPTTLDDLFVPDALPLNLQQFDLNTRLGWHGPYVLHVRTAADLLDAWGNPVVLQNPADPDASAEDNARNTRLVSPGPDGVLDTPTGVDNLTPGELEDTECNDDLVLFLRIAGAPCQ